MNSRRQAGADRMINSAEANRQKGVIALAGPMVQTPKLTENGDYHSFQCPGWKDHKERSTRYSGVHLTLRILLCQYVRCLSECWTATR